MKKLIIMLLMTILAAALVFNGCGGTSTTTPAAATTSAATTSAATTSAAATSVATTPAAITQTEKPLYGGVLKYINMNQPTASIGYVTDMRGLDRRYSSPAVENLIAFDKNGEPYGWLAEDWEWSDDYLDLTFHLRQGVKFHDGTDFNAEAVKWNLETAREGKVYGSSDWKSIDVIDEHTIKIHYDEFFNTALYNLSRQCGNIFSPTAFETLGREGVKWNPVGTGPFKLKNYVPDSYLEYEKFPDYWIEGLPYLDGVKYVFIADPVTAGIAFKAGEGDAIWLQGGAGRTLCVEWKALGNPILVSDKLVCGSYGIFYDSAHPSSIFADKKVREAIEYAIDREKIVNAIGEGYWYVCDQVAPATHVFHVDSLENRSYNPDKAKALLAEAGYPNGFTTPFYVCNEQDGEHILAIQADLKAVGINAEVSIITAAKWNENRIKGWDNAIMYSLTGGGGVTSFSEVAYRTFLNQSVWYPATTVYKPAELEDLLQQGMREPDFDKYVDLTQQAVKLIHEESVITPLWLVTEGRPIYPKVHNFYESESWEDPLWLAFAATWLGK